MRSIYHCITIVCIILIAVFIESCKKEVFVEPQADSEVISYQKIFINSSPAGANIYVNGRTTGLVTPDTVKWLNEENYQITLKKKYFWDTTFSISAQKNLVSSGYVDYYKSERMLGQIECGSIPSGAKIYIDNVYTGKVTPAVISKLIPKIYSVKYEYPEYRKDSLDIIVESRSKVQCGISLEDTLDVITYNQKNSNLPTNYYSCIGEDNKGDIWIGSQGDGLLKYDGKKFTLYNHLNSNFVLSSYINYIKKGQDGDLWVAFSNGIGRFDGNSWQVSFKTSWINSLNVSPNNVALAAADRGGGLVRYSNNKFELLTQEHGDIPNNFVATACYDKMDNLWIGRIKDGIDLLSNGTWSHLDSAKNGLPNSNVRILDILDDGTLIGLFHYMYDIDNNVSYCTLSRFINGKWVEYHNFLVNLDLMRTNLDSKERFWVGSNNYLFRVNGINSVTRIQQIVKLNSIRKYATIGSAELIKSNFAFVDSKNNLWLLVPAKGIIKIKPGRWND